VLRVTSLLSPEPIGHKLLDKCWESEIRQHPDVGLPGLRASGDVDHGGRTNVKSDKSGTICRLDLNLGLEVIEKVGCGGWI